MTGTAEGVTAAVRLARRAFVAGERIDLNRLSAELGVDRTTLFRWVGNRDQLIGTVLISLADPTLRGVAERTGGCGPERVGRIMGEFSRAVIEAPYYRAFLRRETERALRLITTRAGPVQRHVVEAVRELVRAELARSDRVPTMPLPDLAYLVTRIAESFIYTDLISGEDPDADKAEAAVTALLRGASRPR
ncbi:QsdR family transcriptional regulator [Pseudonocardia sp. D17]|jgi:AcrR family transcriptional regulator|uniref:QsdR family transcriptional regulator n=1 Tax=Pseudonocardia sp. D17 TaxID=882661 RepID=UPI002B365937|nr:hypothetical protein PSD17_52020 [Pseudonocardia sp. D17]